MKNIMFTVALLLAGGALAQPADLGGQWKLVGWTLPDAVPVKGKLPVLTFEGQRVTGHAGCNRLTGTVTQNGAQLAFSGLATTRMACDRPVMEQEQAFLKALSGQTLRADRRADSLTLTGADGYMLNLRRRTTPLK